MNRGFLLILAPALLAALIYWGLGYRPSPRGLAGVLLFVVIYFLVLRRRRSAAKS
jgi:drug/metabolite transporter (DMT)-like permease